MKTPPSITEIEKWITERNPSNLFDTTKTITVSDIDPKPWSGHFGFLLSDGNKEAVLRFKGPEWGTPEGIVHEHAILKKAEPYKVGPRALHLEKTYWREPALIEEYLKGTLLTSLSLDDARKEFPRVAKFIRTINDIPFEINELPFEEPLTSYTHSKKRWRYRIEDILDCRHTHTCKHELLALLSGIESRLDEFEHRLVRVINSAGPAFLFESSHAGHCLKTHDGFRFFNWEQVSYGDPSFTLAVFLTSIKERPDFPEVKKEMVESFLSMGTIPEFSELLEQRLWERTISNTIYATWSKARDTITEKSSEIAHELALRIQSLREYF